MSLVLLTGLAIACGGQAGPTTPAPMLSAVFDFSAGQQGWVGGFAGYYDGQQGDAEVTTRYRALPAPLTSMGSALYFFGNAFGAGGPGFVMYFKRPWTGLMPNQSYGVTFTAQIATNTEGNPSCFGGGGPPGSSTFMKAAVSRTEPSAIPVPTRAGVPTRFNLSTDIGFGPTDGSEGVTLGTIGNSHACGDRTYELKDLISNTGILVSADTSGGAWLLVGIQFAGCECVLDTYVTKFSATFTPQ